MTWDLQERAARDAAFDKRDAKIRSEGYGEGRASRNADVQQLRKEIVSLRESLSEKEKSLSGLLGRCMRLERRLHALGLSDEGLEIS